jgi:glutathione S-transferase
MGNLARIALMILVGQYDSPYVRRVAISLRALDFDYEHDTRSVFGDFDSMRTTNPLGRIPSLILDNGETLIDSAAILDWLDEQLAATAPFFRAADPNAAKPCVALHWRPAPSTSLAARITSD